MKIFKFVLAILCVMIFSLNVKAQIKTEIKPETQIKPERLTDEEIQEFKQYQFYLDKPANGIEKIKYANDDTPIEGQISKDGKRVIMDGYIKRGRVTAVVRYKDGTTEEVSRSSCVIDPVIPL